ncbi:MAG: hypothetical protein Q4E05_02695 [Pseudoclavibacter sp.]|nr:hypothetical protein [Pseudoclavibacter sp.]
MEWIANAVWSVVPTILIGAFFLLMIRAITRLDRDERKSFARIEREERERLGLPDPGTGPETRAGEG